MDITSVSQLNMTALRQVIAKVLTLPDHRVRLPNENALTGNKSFITVKDITSTTIGSGYKFDGEDEQEYITVSKETLVSVNAYGKESVVALAKLEASLKTSYAMQALKSAGMAIPRASAIRNLTGALGGGYEERGQIDLTVSHINRIKAAMMRADTVEITAEGEK